MNVGQMLYRTFAYCSAYLRTFIECSWLFNVSSMSKNMCQMFIKNLHNLNLLSKHLYNVPEVRVNYASKWVFVDILVLFFYDFYSHRKITIKIIEKQNSYISKILFKGTPEVKTQFFDHLVCSYMKQYILGNTHVKF